MHAYLKEKNSRAYIWRRVATILMFGDNLYFFSQRIFQWFAGARILATIKFVKIVFRFEGWESFLFLEAMFYLIKAKLSSFQGRSFYFCRLFKGLVRACRIST